jgi:ribosomal-protein-alanine N-acetyltransferase
MRLVGDRIELREHVTDDWAALASYQLDQRYTRFNPDLAVHVHAKGLVDLFVKWSLESPRRNYQLAIVHRETGTLIGSGGLRTAGMAVAEAEFGLELSPEWWGRGLATESSRILLRFGFVSLALEQVRGVSVTENERVSRLVRGLGFVSRLEPVRDGSMRTHGWTLTEWTLTRDVWMRDAG